MEYEGVGDGAFGLFGPGRILRAVYKIDNPNSSDISKRGYQCNISYMLLGEDAPPANARSFQ